MASAADVLREKEDELTELKEGVVPLLRAQPPDVDMLFQRDDWPAEPVRLEPEP